MPFALWSLQVAAQPAKVQGQSHQNVPQDCLTNEIMTAMVEFEKPLNAQHTPVTKGAVICYDGISRVDSVKKGFYQFIRAGGDCGFGK